MFAERDLDNGNGDLFRGDAAVCGHHVREELRKVCGRFARLDGAICRRRCKAEHGQFVRILVIVVIFLRRGRGDVLGGQALRPCIILLHESDRLFLRHADADGVHRDGAEGRSRPVDDLDVQDFSDVRARVDVLAQHIFGKFGIFKVLRGGNDKEFFVRFAVADGDVNVILSRTAQKQGDDAVACQRELGGAHGARKGFVVLVSVEELLPFRVEGTGVPEQLGRVPDDARTEGVAFQHQPVVHAVLEIAVLDGRLGGIFAELGGADLGKLVVALFLRRLDFRFRLIHLKVVQVDVGIFFRVPLVVVSDLDVDVLAHVFGKVGDVADEMIGDVRRVERGVGDLQKGRIVALFVKLDVAFVPVFAGTQQKADLARAAQLEGVAGERARKLRVARLVAAEEVVADFPHDHVTHFVGIDDAVLGKRRAGLRPAREVAHALFKPAVDDVVADGIRFLVAARRNSKGGRRKQKSGKDESHSLFHDLPPEKMILFRSHEAMLP